MNSNRRYWLSEGMGRIKFMQFNSVLLELGFQMKVIPGKCVVYWHQASDLIMPVRIMNQDEIVPDYQLAATRSQLDARCIIDAAEFEGLLKTAAR